MEKKQKIEEAYKRWSKIRKLASLITRLKDVSDNKLQRKESVINKIRETKQTFWEKLVIDPESQTKQIFDLFVSFVIIFDILLSSFNFLLTTQQSITALILIFTGVLFIDMITKFFQPYSVRNIKITTPSRIVLNYLSTTFVLDLCAIFPFFLFLENLYWLRLILLLHFDEASTRITNFFCLIISYIIPVSKPALQGINRLIKFTLALMVLLHIFACIWANLGNAPGGWISQKADLLADKMDDTIYLASLYWSMTIFSTIGYGDIVPTSISDCIFTMIIFLVGVCMFSYLLGNVNGLVQQMNSRENIKSKQKQDLEDWLLKLDRVGKEKRLGNEQIDFINSYMDGYWRLNLKELEKSSEFFLQLPPPLRKKLIFDYLLLNTREKFSKFFCNLDPNFVRKIMLNMAYEKHQLKNDSSSVPIIFHFGGKVPKFVYFVLSGRLGLFSFDGQESYLDLLPGSVFGEAYILFDLQTPYTLKFDPFFYSSKKNVEENTVEIYKVEASAYLSILQNFPKVRRVLKKEALIKRNIYRQVKRERIGAQEPFPPTRITETARVLLTEEDRQRLLSEVGNTVRETVHLDPLGQNSKQCPEGQTSVFHLFNEDPKPLLKTEEDKERSGIILSMPSQKRISEILFSEEVRKNPNHREVLKLEIEYNSEEEFGTEDVFDKKQVVTASGLSYQRIGELKNEIQFLRQAVKDIDSLIGEQIDSAKKVYHSE